jgi:uncharacterized membrane protein YbhN (UPF0104 family)
MSWPRIFDPHRKAKSRRILAILFKATVSAVLLAFLAGRIELRGVGEALSKARLDDLAWATAGYLGLQLFGVYRWRVLSGVMGFDRSFGQYSAYYFAGLFFNLFLPTTVGGDVGRCFYLAGGKERFVPALITILADRSCGMTAIMGIAAVALFFSTAVHVPIWIMVFTVGSASLLLIAWVLPYVVPGLFRVKGFPLEYWIRPGPMILALLISFGVQIAVVGIHRLIGAALDLEIPLSFYFVFTPLVMAVSAVPISLNGLGVREGAYVFFLVQAAVDGATALAFALLWLFVSVVTSLFGGLAWIFMPSLPKRTPEAQKPGEEIL